MRWIVLAVLAAMLCGCTTVKITAYSGSTVTVDAHKRVTATTSATIPAGALGL